MKYLVRMQYFSCGSDKYSEIKMCDLESFSKIRSHIIKKSEVILKVQAGRNGNQETCLALYNIRSSVLYYSTKLMYSSPT